MAPCHWHPRYPKTLRHYTSLGNDAVERRDECEVDFPEFMAKLPVTRIAGSAAVASDVYV